MFMRACIAIALLCCSTLVTAGPVLYEENLGQSPKEVRFKARYGASILELTDRGVILRDRTAKALSMTFVGARAGELRGERPLARVNYFIGSDPARWLQNVRTFERVTYPELYPGIDAEFHGSEGNAEFDFIVAPGADLSRIRIAVDGHRSLRVVDGDILIDGTGGELRLKKPITYQYSGQRRVPVASRYRLAGRNEIALVVSHDRRRPLIIDPVLVYSSYFGAADKTGEGAEYIGRDSAGNMVLVGSTDAVEFPGASPRAPMAAGDSSDAFVTKLSPDGRNVLWTTFIGGRGRDRLSGAVSTSGDIVLGGFTASNDFPVVAPIQATIGGETDVAIARLSADGTELKFSTYLGGPGEDFGALKLDAEENAIVVGDTTWSSFPTRNALFNSIKGGRDGFVLKLSPANEILFSTFFGSNDRLDGAQLVDIAPDNSIYITGSLGESGGAGLPLVNALQSTFGGYVDSYLARISSDGRQLFFSTMFGGSGHDRIGGGAADANGVVFSVATSSDLPTKNAFQPTSRGADAYLARVKADGSDIEWATWFGGTGGDSLSDIAIDREGNLILAGSTTSTDFPLVAPVRSTLGGDTDGFVAKLSSAASSLLFSTFVGGSDREGAYTVDVDADGTIVVTGNTQSPDLPNINGLPIARSGYSDTFIVMLRDEFTGSGALHVIPVVGSLAGGHGSFFRTSVQLHNPKEEMIGGRFVFHPQGASGSTSDPSSSFWLGPRQTLSFGDLLPSMGATGIGSVDIVTEANATPIVLSRVFNDAGVNGTSGMSEPRIAPAAALQAEMRAVLLSPTDLAKLRFNVGVRTLSTGATVSFTIRRPDGTIKTTVTKEFPADYFVQSAAEAFLGVAVENNDAIEIGVTSGSLIVYGSITDNKTQDPSMQLALLPATDSGVRFIPVAGSTPGAANSFFRTAVQIHNPSDAPSRGRFIYHPAGASGSTTDPSLPFELAARETRAFADLAGTMQQQGIGSVDVITETGVAPLIVARIFNDAGDLGTSGMMEIGVRKEDALGNGDRAIFFAPPSTDVARLNVGVRSLENGAKLRVQVRSAAGNVVGEATREFAPTFFTQTTAQIFTGIAVADGDALEVSVLEGQAIVYATTTDNKTQDPTLQLAERIE